VDSKEKDAKVADLQRMLDKYEGQADNIMQQPGCFKASAAKKDNTVEFLPTNLHLHSMHVYQQANVPSFTPEDNIFDFVTVGIPAAHALGFKHGGLSKLRQEVANIRKKIIENPNCGPKQAKKYHATLDKTVMSMQEREDVAFSQALSALVTAVARYVNLRVQTSSSGALEQMKDLGLLVGWESLVSTAGHELVMLSDGSAAIHDLNNVKFKLIKLKEGERPPPLVPLERESTSLLNQDSMSSDSVENTRLSTVDDLDNCQDGPRTPPLGAHKKKASMAQFLRFGAKGAHSRSRSTMERVGTPSNMSSTESFIQRIRAMSVDNKAPLLSSDSVVVKVEDIGNDQAGTAGSSSSIGLGDSIPPPPIEDLEEYNFLPPPPLGELASFMLPTPVAPPAPDKASLYQGQGQDAEAAKPTGDKGNRRSPPRDKKHKKQPSTGVNFWGDANKSTTREVELQEVEGPKVQKTRVSDLVARWSSPKAKNVGGLGEVNLGSTKARASVPVPTGPQTPPMRPQRKTLGVKKVNFPDGNNIGPPTSPPPPLQDPLPPPAAEGGGERDRTASALDKLRPPEHPPSFDMTSNPPPSSMDPPPAQLPGSEGIPVTLVLLPPLFSPPPKRW
jgi:hypothetical protein